MTESTTNPNDIDAAQTPLEHRRSMQIAGQQEVDVLLDRIAAEIHETFGEADNLLLVGIRRRGDVLAHRLQARLKDLMGSEPPCGALDITLYRDDFDSLAEHPVVGDTHLPFAVGESTIILVDDVLYTGRTIRAALDELLDLGRPNRIALAVLIDRGWRELPIAADIVGKHVTTEREDDVQVLVSEIDDRDAVNVIQFVGEE